ncbi:MAG: hypothetical protein WBE13_15320 [Candidatus Acidiferrum sp.]
MDDALRQSIERVNARLALLLEEARRALKGECGFDVGDVRRLREILREMVPIVARSSELRRQQPEIGSQLDCYRSQLGELQTTLVQLRVMLHGRQARLHASQSHHTAVSRWVSAFRQTR